MEEHANPIENWTQFEGITETLAESLVANNFTKPTVVQANSLVFNQAQLDLVIAAKTGQGKTLCFGIPVLNSLIKKIQKVEDALSSESEEADEEQEGDLKNAPKLKKRVFDSVKCLIVSPTRELAMQIDAMIKAVIPLDYEDQIKTCCLVGGMSIQKQQRLLSYKPAIIVATPGRLWELMDDHMEPYLLNGLPMIDTLVLDEADRMIADGHFKELTFILNHIYNKRVLFKKEALAMKKTGGGKVGLTVSKEKILGGTQDAVRVGNKNFKVGLNQEVGSSSYDASKVVDLDAEENDELMADEHGEIVFEENTQDIKKEANKKAGKKLKKKKEAERTAEEEEAFKKEYMKMGGIQHIICSATMTIDNKGRLTPRQEAYNKKKNIDIKEKKSTLEALCTTLRFRSKHPKVIDLTEEDQKMPDTLVEQAVKCKVEEKDLYMYYYMQENKGKSMIVFCNAITATRRLTSLLDFMKIKNCCLHSKMQQRQRLKNLDRFKRGVRDIESGHSQEAAVLVCTDVAARGLDIPNVSNVLHYQCPFNAEIYVHRCGRTARIGKDGHCLNLLGPDDNKAFRTICQVLKKDADTISMYDIKYTQLERMRPLIEQAKEIEKTMHRSKQEEKSANATLNMAKDGDLNLDEQMQYQLQKALGKKAAAQAEFLSDSRLKQFEYDATVHKKRLDKQKMKDAALKANYNREIESQKIKKFSNSSYLTPEAAIYLNELVYQNHTKVDEEIVYAGLHSQNKDKLKFKRSMKGSTKYTKERTNRRHKKGRLG